MTSRRVILSLTGALLVAPIWRSGAVAQDANETWVDLRRYMAAVVNLFSGANSRVEAINVAGVDPQLKAVLRNELDSLASALGRLLAPKWIFVEDLRGYLRRAKLGEFDSEEQRRDAWSSIRGEIGQIALAAREVLDIVTR